MQALNNLNRKDDTRQLTGSKNPGDAPFVIQHVDRVAGVNLLLLRVIIVDQDIVRLLEGAAFDVFETAADFFECLKINAGNGKNAAHRRNHGSDRGRDMRFLFQKSDELLW